MDRDILEDGDDSSQRKRQRSCSCESDLKAKRRLQQTDSPRNNSDALITAVNFVTYGNKKVRAFVGTYDGRITVLDITASNTLDYHTALDIRLDRST